MNMEEVLHEKVIGQDEAIGVISKAVRRARAGLKNPKRPTGIFLFLGPTGVGKTYLVQKLAEFMFGERGVHDPDRHVRVHGAALGGPVGGRAPWIHRLRRGWTAHRGRAEKVLLRDTPR